MNLTDLLKAQENYFNREDDTRAFIAGAKYVIERLVGMTAGDAITAIASLFDNFNQEKKWVKVKSIDTHHRCENCDRFIYCETIKNQKISFCQMYNPPIVFKRKEQWEHLKETD